MGSHLVLFLSKSLLFTHIWTKSLVVSIGRYCLLDRTTYRSYNGDSIGAADAYDAKSPACCCGEGTDSLIFDHFFFAHVLANTINAKPKLSNTTIAPVIAPLLSANSGMMQQMIPESTLRRANNMRARLTFTCAFSSLLAVL